MSNIILFLRGKKTFIVAVLFGLYNLGLAMGWWTADSQTVEAVNTILGAFGLAFLRAGVSKSK